MMTDTQTPPLLRSERSIAVWLAAGSSALMSFVYLLIGLRVIEVIDPTEDQPAFGFAAAAFFALLTAVILAVRRPIVWLVAIAVHLFVAFVYVDLATERVPQYETWGVALRVLQLPAVVALAWLLARRSASKG